MSLVRISSYGLLIACAAAGCDAAVPPQTPGPAAEATSPPAEGTSPPAATQSGALSIALPGGPPGIGFGELRFSSFSDYFDAVVVPAGRTGNVILIDPGTGKVTPVGGFSSSASYSGAADFGVTSAEGDFDGLFAIDRTAKKLFIADPLTKKILGSVAVAATPESMRYFFPLRQVWVAEPEKEQIEIFAVGQGAQAAFSTGHLPAQDSVVATKGGPGAIVFDVHQSRAYTLLGGGNVMSIDAFEGKVAATWPSGCKEARGIDVDSPRGLVFVGCAEGKVAVLDAASGRSLATVEAGPSVDAIAYTGEPARFGHLYVASAQGGTLTVFGVSAKGETSRLGTLPTAAGARCVVADKSGNAYVCDPAGGRILRLKDPYPPSR